MYAVAPGLIGRSAAMQPARSVASIVTRAKPSGATRARASGISNDTPSTVGPQPGPSRARSTVYEWPVELEPLSTTNIWVCPELLKRLPSSTGDATTTFELRVNVTDAPRDGVWSARCISMSTRSIGVLPVIALVGEITADTSSPPVRLSSRTSSELWHAPEEQRCRLKSVPVIEIALPAPLEHWPWDDRPFPA